MKQVTDGGEQLLIFHDTAEVIDAYQVSLEVYKANHPVTKKLLGIMHEVIVEESPAEAVGVINEPFRSLVINALAKCATEDRWGLQATMMLSDIHQVPVLTAV